MGLGEGFESLGQRLRTEWVYGRGSTAQHATRPLLSPAAPLPQLRPHLLQHVLRQRAGAALLPQARARVRQLPHVAPAALLLVHRLLSVRVSVTQPRNSAKRGVWGEAPGAWEASVPRGSGRNAIPAGCGHGLADWKGQPRPPGRMELTCLLTCLDRNASFSLGCRRWLWLRCNFVILLLSFFTFQKLGPVLWRLYYCSEQPVPLPPHRTVPSLLQSQRFATSHPCEYVFGPAIKSFIFHSGAESVRTRVRITGISLGAAPVSGLKALLEGSWL